MTASFKAEPGTREFGFTDPNGNAVTRRPENGIVTARDAFEERHFRTIGLEEVAPPKAKRKGSAKRKSSAKRAGAKADTKPPAGRRFTESSTAATAPNESTKAAAPADTVEG